MKNVLLVLVTLFALNGYSIEFITEAQVGEALEASKVIEVNKANVKALIPGGSHCEQEFYSKSARFYVVKKGYDAFLYATPSGLNGLTVCADL